eukprot:scaffold137347_cov23-Tisochrysis_lutea.AAC.1
MHVPFTAGPAGSSLPAVGSRGGGAHLEYSPQAPPNSADKQPGSAAHHCAQQQQPQQQQHGATSPSQPASPRSRRTMRRMQKGAVQQQQQTQQQQEPLCQEQQQGIAVVEDPGLVGRHLPPQGVTLALLSSLQEYREVTACK